MGSNGSTGEQEQGGVKVTGWGWSSGTWGHPKAPELCNPDSHPLDSTAEGSSSLQHSQLLKYSSSAHGTWHSPEGLHFHSVDSINTQLKKVRQYESFNDPFCITAQVVFYIYTLHFKSRSHQLSLQVTKNCFCLSFRVVFCCFGFLIN